MHIVFTKYHLHASCTKAQEISLNFWASIPGRQGKQIMDSSYKCFKQFNNNISHERFEDFCPSWNFHHVCMASVGGPMFFSNIYAYSNLKHDNLPYFTQDEHSWYGLNMISTKTCWSVPHDSMVITQHQLIKNYTHNLHNDNHNRQKHTYYTWNSICYVGRYGGFWWRKFG